MKKHVNLHSSCVVIIVIIILTSFQYTYVVSDERYILAKTMTGLVRGRMFTKANVNIAYFLGIPYAKPPTGKLRFRPPHEPESWSGVKDVFHYEKMCFQGHKKLLSAMSEDCLFLNIFSPQTTDTKPLPVMLWIHGGGYLYGTSRRYDGSNLAQRGVVVVTINYRLDLFGFLSTEDNILPGNYGMLDQIAALKWVKSNIIHFGGDPSQVTIFGESAGSSSVSLLILSPLAAGLFHRAILQSGVAFSPWGYQHPGNRVSNKMIAEVVALEIGCNNVNDPANLFICLQKADASKIIDASIKVYKLVDSNFIVTPRVDSSDGFLPALPYDIFRNGTFNHVDTIHGFNSDESAMFLMQKSILNNAEKSMKFWLKQLRETDKDEVYSMISKRYTSRDPATQPRRSLDSQDDIAFIGPIISELNLQAKTAPEKNHFLYEFNYKPLNSNPSWISATHASELRYLFAPHLKGEERRVSDAMLDMWTRFAKTGQPSVDWSPYTRNNQSYLFIASKSVEKFWANFTTDNVYYAFSKKLEGMSVI